MNRLNKVLQWFCDVVVQFVTRIVSFVKLPIQTQYYSAQTYFPEFSDRKKTKLTIFIEQIINIIKYGLPNRFYFLYGLDIKKRNLSNEFVDYTLFVRRRNEMNNRISKTPPIVILRDKVLFGITASAYGINTPKNIGIIKNGYVYQFNTKATASLTKFVKHTDGILDVFVKKIDGECSDGVFHIQIIGGEIYYKGKKIDGNVLFENNERYLIQSTISNQHQAITKLFSKAINTLRLVTVHNLNSNEIEVFSCVLRVGTGENNVDNWAAGGLSIGVDTDKGTLRKYGFYKPGFGTKATEHPDTHIVFEGYKIPYLNESIEQAKEFHRHLFGIHSIGWDIAITEEGPCFVEGNDNWEISLMQISNHGLKKEFDRVFY